MRKTQYLSLGLLGLGLVAGCNAPSITERSCQANECQDDAENVDGDVCGPLDTDLIAGQHIDTGTVQVSNDAETLTISVLPDGPYALDQVHIYVGTDPVPTNGGGGVAPGQFPYIEEFVDPVASHQLQLPLADLAVSCGEVMTIAVHAAVVSSGQGNPNFQETGWAFGAQSFAKGWGWSISYELCCDGGGGDGGGGGGGGGGGDDGGGGDGDGDGGDGGGVDDDGDGVDAEHDCDDNDARIGALLYENHFDDDDGYLGLGPKLLDPWTFDGEAHTTDGGQQALLGQPELWANTVTFGTLRVSGVERECGNACDDDHTRFRAGYLARTSEDADQDEGYHGYRCAVARNSGEDCYDEGPFVQIGAFLDGPEDDISSECTNGCAPNPTFDQLAREERSEGTSLINGDSASLVFWTVGQDLVCEFYGNDDEHVVARAVDDRFDSGTTGLSTLNALADFDHVRVCQAFETP